MKTLNIKISSGDLIDKVDWDAALEMILAIDFGIAEEEFTIKLINRLMATLEGFNKEEIKWALGLHEDNAEMMDG